MKNPSPALHAGERAVNGEGLLLFTFKGRVGERLSLFP